MGERSQSQFSKVYKYIFIYKNNKRYTRRKREKRPNNRTFFWNIPRRPSVTCHIFSQSVSQFTQKLSIRSENTRVKQHKKPIEKVNKSIIYINRSFAICFFLFMLLFHALFVIQHKNPDLYAPPADLILLTYKKTL